MALPRLPVPTPPAPSLPFPGPSARSLRRTLRSSARTLLGALRPSPASVDAALLGAGFVAGLGVIATAVYAAADCVPPLALLAGVLRGVRERVAP